VGNSQRQRAAAAAFASDGGNDRHFNPRHLAQVAGDCFCLAALFRSQPWIRTRRIDKSEDRPLKLFRHLHAAQSLAIALWIRLAEVAIHTLLGVAALLVANHHHFVAVITSHAADNRGIVAVTPVAVDFTPVAEDPLHIVQRERTLRMPRHLRLLPGIDVLANLLAQKRDLMLQMLELEMSVLVSARFGFELDNLLFNRLKLALRFNGWIQISSELLATRLLAFWLYYSTGF